MTHQVEAGPISLFQYQGQIRYPTIENRFQRASSCFKDRPQYHKRSSHTTVTYMQRAQVGPILVLQLFIQESSLSSHKLRTTVFVGLPIMILSPHLSSYNSSTPSLTGLPEFSSAPNHGSWYLPPSGTGQRRHDDN